MNTKTNIIWLMADDMGYGDPACNGDGKIATPNMDRLAREGVRFTDAHAASAVCTPSRYSVITGRYNWRSSLKKSVIGGFTQPLIDSARPTVASFMKGSKAIPPEPLANGTSDWTGNANPAPTQRAHTIGESRATSITNAPSGEGRSIWDSTVSLD